LLLPPLRRGHQQEALAAVPWTASCIACQQAADGMVGQPSSVIEELLVSAG